jgi:glutaminase
MFEDNIRKIYNKVKPTHSGKNADYIPELAKVNPKLFAISIYTIDGYSYNIGDYTTDFAIESCSKIFTLALALEKYGIKTLQSKIGELKAFDKFNSINEIVERKHTLNSFSNGGAMATTSLLYNKNKKLFEKKILDNMNNFAGRKLHINNKIYHSEFSHVDHNLSIAYLLKSLNRFYGDVQETVDVYTRQCSVRTTTQDLAIMAATLANKGFNPKTNKQVIDSKYISYILKHMEDNGLYEESDDVTKTIGFPSKSGVSGSLLVVIPGVMGIGIYSPRLNKYGNSVKGLKTMKLLSKYIKDSALKDFPS